MPFAIHSLNGSEMLVGAPTAVEQPVSARIVEFSDSDAEILHAATATCEQEGWKDASESDLSALLEVSYIQKMFPDFTLPESQLFAETTVPESQLVVEYRAPESQLFDKSTVPESQMVAESTVPEPQIIEPDLIDDQAEDRIRCICEDNYEYDGWDMVACDECHVWQHTDCMEVRNAKYWKDKRYFCELCRPENHRELLKRGYQPYDHRTGLPLTAPH
ncbi:hypothetical protein DM02DRAFT_655873 [Periconia macrospinosa]|uniref:Zinc finger PHD-type domain-containing protein n=1 Tax=Periconia macrospinosa TaxID=97972 RepID=A0A2V1DPJ0_9PLEO|nr:hypothetical protein DM02DRAFT_655873 [Periconia macrospinosa]